MLYKLGKYENIATAVYIIEMMIALKLLNWQQKRLTFQYRMIEKGEYFSLSVDKVSFRGFSLPFMFVFFSYSIV